MQKAFFRHALRRIYCKVKYIAIYPLRLNPSRVVTYAISEKDYDKTLLTNELIDPDKQVRLELWAYNPKQFSEDNSADDISIVLSFTDTNDERIEEAVDELQERRLKE